MAKKGDNQSEDNQSKDYSIMTRLLYIVIPTEYE